MRKQNKERHNRNFLYITIGMIFGAIILTSLVREMLEMHKNALYTHLVSTGSSRPHDAFGMQQNNLRQNQLCPESRKDESGSDKRHDGKKYKGAKFFDVHVNQISRYEKLLPIRAGILTPFIEFRKNGYYTVQLIGEDLAKSAPGRKDTSLTLRECIYESVFIKCSIDAWKWESNIEFTYVDVFSAAGSMLALTYNAPKGFITYIGMNSTISVRDQILPMRLVFAS